MENRNLVATARSIGPMLTLLLVATTALAPSPAPVATPPGLQITKCTATRGSAPYTNTWTDRKGKTHTYENPRGQGYISIWYVNGAPEPLTDITFGFVAKGKMVAREHDTGTFSQGIAIRHSFNVSDQLFPLGTALTHCVVLKLRYANGTTWTNPSPPQQ